MINRRRIGVALVLAGIVAAGFAYGVTLERTRAFPYNVLNTVYLSARNALRPSAPLPRGRWHRYDVRRQARDLTEEQLAQIERLETMAYLSGSKPATEQAGVTLHDPGRAQQGLNLVVSGHAAWAGLVDMSGNVLHEWRREFRDVWPDNPISDDAVGTHHWHHVHLYENGDILAVFQGVGLIKLDSESNLLWDRPGGYHHDLKVVDDGSIYILDQKAHIVPRWNQENPVLENFITALDSEGLVRSRVSLLAAFENSPYSPTLEWAPTVGDPFHSNSIQLLDGTLSDQIPAFEEGNVLVSIRELDTIAVVDVDAESVVWAASGQWRRQHDATLLPNGRILLFDNWHATGVSEVLEFDPLTQTVEWSYAGSEERPFYSETVGTNQRLPNGNTLIVESDNGRAFEVTTGGEIVWEYVSPYRAGEGGELIATLFDVVRLPADFPTEWARSAEQADPAARRSPEAGGG